VGLVRVGGELLAIPHRQARTGYKAPNAYGAKSTFSGETTYRHYNNRTLTVSGPGSKKLMPYGPWASRNRPASAQQNIVGRRYGTHPTSVEAYKGSSTVGKMLRSGGVDGDSPWRTTNQVFNECAMVRNTVGLQNQGIASTLARTMHKRQGIYGKQ